MARKAFGAPPDPLVSENRKITDPWSKYFSAIDERGAQSSSLTGRISLTTQSASIANTNIPIQTTYTAEYRVSYYVRVTRAATTSSDITVTIAWTEGGVSLTQDGTTLNGNLITTTENATLMLVSDGGSPITYSTTYNSTGATAMQYRLTITAELIG